MFMLIHADSRTFPLVPAHSPIIRAAITWQRGIHISIYFIARAELRDPFINPFQTPLRGSRFGIARGDSLSEYCSGTWITRGRLFHANRGVAYESASFIDQLLQAVLRCEQCNNITRRRTGLCACNNRIKLLRICGTLAEFAARRSQSLLQVVHHRGEWFAKWWTSDRRGARYGLFKCGLRIEDPWPDRTIGCITNELSGRRRQQSQERDGGIMISGTQRCFRSAVACGKLVEKSCALVNSCLCGGEFPRGTPRFLEARSFKGSGDQLNTARGNHGRHARPMPFECVFDAAAINTSESRLSEKIGQANSGCRVGCRDIVALDNTQIQRETGGLCWFTSSKCGGSD